MFKRCIQILCFIYFTSYIQYTYSQVVFPTGCSASTGPNVSTIVLQHPESRYHLLAVKWSDIEPKPGQFNFNQLLQKIQTIKSYGKKYALAVGMGGPGTPSWIMDSLRIPYQDYLFRGNTPYRLPLWWDSVLQVRINQMVSRLGNELSSDTSLSLVYITQMTANGNEGHLQFVNIDSLKRKGFTRRRWIDAAEQTASSFAAAFPGKALAFEVHDIDNTSEVAATIINELYANPQLQHRIGVAIWWLSGKTNYQAELLQYIHTFHGQKYAQLIAHSGQPEKFADSNIATAFVQAKKLNVRYIEPWYEEYSSRRIDTLLQDYNQWSDSNFQFTAVTNTESHNDEEISLTTYPNPWNPSTTISYFIPSAGFTRLMVYDILGKLVATLVEGELSAGEYQAEFKNTRLSTGVYYCVLQTREAILTRKTLYLK